MLKSLRDYLGRLVSSLNRQPSEELPVAEAILTLRLLQHPRVQTDLGLSSTQLQRLRQTIQSVRQKHRHKMDALRGQDQEVRLRERPKLQALVATEVAAQIQRQPLLTSEQRERFRQILLQQRAPAVFGDPEVQKALAIDEAQKKQLRSLIEEGRRKARPLIQSGEMDATSARREVMIAVLAALRPEQRTRWQQMTGPAVDIDLPSPDSPTDSP